MTETSQSTQTTQAAPGFGVRGWAIVLVLHLCIALVGTVATAKGVFFPALLEEFKLSHTAGSALLTANVAVSAVVALLISGFLLRYVSLRVLVAGTTALIGLGFLLAGLARSYYELLAAYMIMAGGGVSLIAVPLLANTWFRARRGLTIGLVMAGTTTAGVVVTPVLGRIVTEWGWRAGYLSLAAALLGVMVPLLLLIMKPPPGAGAPQLPASGTESTGALLQALRTRTFWILVIVATIFGGTTHSYFLHFIPSLTVKGYSLVEATSIMSVLFLLAAATKVFFGHVADRTNVRAALVVSLLLAAAGTFLMQYASSTVGLYGLVVLYGLSYSAPLVLMPVLTADVYGTRQFTFFNTIIHVGTQIPASAGPVLAGWIFDRTGGYDPVFFLFSALLLGAGLLALGVRNAVRVDAVSATPGKAPEPIA